MKKSNHFHVVSLGCCLLAFLGVLLLAIPPKGSAAELSRITDIRFWQSPEEARIVIDLSAAPTVSPVNALSDGTLSFEVEGCTFRPGKQRYPLGNAFLSVLTVHERERGRVRVFFRPSPGVVQKTFVLPKNVAKPDRIVIFLSESVAAQAARRAEERQEVSRLKAGNVRIVVIDAGHGGEDPGTRNNGIIEKDYVLETAIQVKALFDQNPRYRAILTRTGDYIVPLERRRQIAEHLTADAFVSIHANFNRKRSIAGIEVYYESPKGAVGEAERLVADTENEQDAIGGVAPRHDFRTTTKQDILQRQANVMFKSGQFAEKMAMHLGRAIPGLSLRGVKRAGFRVLHSMALPSILVELGYVSNAQDAALMRHPAAKPRFAQAIYNGVVDFLEGRIQEGMDPTYLSYVAEVEAAKKARAERIRAARERRARMLKNSKSYKVRRGDKLPSVAAKFKVSVANIDDLNGLRGRRKLREGEVLRIPAR